MASTDPDAAAQHRREVLSGDVARVRRLTSVEEVLEALYHYAPSLCAGVAFDSDPVRRPEGHGQAPHDLTEPPHRMCYDYNHAIKYWEIDE